VLQQPADSLWSLDQRVQLDPGTSLLTGLCGEGSRVPALLVSVGSR